MTVLQMDWGRLDPSVRGRIMGRVTNFAVRDGLWYPRKPEIDSGEVIRTLAKMRMVPDLIFMAGALLMLGFVVRAVVLTMRKSPGENQP